MELAGYITGIPVSKGEDRIFTVEVRAYLRKEAGTNVFATFPIHCIFAGSARWETTFLPPVGRWTSVMVDAVGTYTVDDELALAAAVQNFTPAPSRPPPESPAPGPSSSVPSTPKYVLFT